MTISGLKLLAMSFLSRYIDHIKDRILPTRRIPLPMYLGDLYQQKLTPSKTSIDLLPMTLGCSVLICEYDDARTRTLCPFLTHSRER